MGIGKRGNVVIDAGFGVIVIMIFVVALIFLNYTLSPVYEDIIDNDEMSDTSKDMARDARDVGIHTVNNWAMWLAVVMFIGVILTAFFVDVHPVIAAILFIALIIVGYALMLLSNEFETMLTNPEIYSFVAANFSVGFWIATHPLELYLSYFFIGILVMFGKKKVIG